MVGREYSTDACNNIAIEFISIPLERTDGIEMSFCGSLMMKYYKYGDRQNKLKAMLKTFSNKNQNEKVAFRNFVNYKQTQHQNIFISKIKRCLLKNKKE